MARYRTAMGRSLDMEALVAKNEQQEQWAICL